MPRRDNLLLLFTDIVSVLYCTFFVVAEGFVVAPKLKLHLQKLGDLWRR